MLGRLSTFRTAALISTAGAIWLIINDLSKPVKLKIIAVTPRGLSLVNVQGGWAAILYGVGAALTLDEFALWLNLRDVYWSREGRESIDAIILFGALLAAGAWGAPLFKRAVKKRKPAPRN